MKLPAYLSWRPSPTGVNAAILTMADRQDRHSRGAQSFRYPRLTPRPDQPIRSIRGLDMGLARVPKPGCTSRMVARHCRLGLFQPSPVLTGVVYLYGDRPDP